MKLALFEVNKAMDSLQEAFSLLSSHLIGQSRSYSRCLFTNSFPKLGILTNTLSIVTETLDNINKNFSSFQSFLSKNLISLLNKLQINEEERKKLINKNYLNILEKYEKNLLSSLLQREIEKENEKELCNLREEFELQRFDYVRKLNQNNSQKKFILTQVINSLLLLSLFFYSLSFFEKLRRNNFFF